MAGAGDLAERLRTFLEVSLANLKGEILITDWKGQTYSLGCKQPHWR